MRVAHCIHGLGLGGAQEVIRQIVAGRRGDFTYYVYTCEGGSLLARLEAAGARVRVLPRRLPKLDPGWVARLARAMRADGIEIVHTHLFGDSLHGYLAAQAAGGLPVVMTLHSERTLSTRLQRVGYRWLLPRAAQVVACGNSVRGSYDAWHVPRPMRTVTNGLAAAPAPPAAPMPVATEAPGAMGAAGPPGAAGGAGTPGVAAAAGADAGMAVAGLRAELGLPAGALTFGTVGRLVAVKGHRYLIEALAGALPSMPAPVRLVLLGDGPLAPDLRARTVAAGLAEQVVFAGFRDDVARLLPALDVVVFSSVSEGLPMALLEAMAAARCIVASDLPGIVEAVRHGSEALIVRPAAVPELRSALLRAAADPGLRARLGQAARQRFLESYTSPRMVASYETIYRQVWRAAQRFGPRAVAPAA